MIAIEGEFVAERKDCCGGCAYGCCGAYRSNGDKGTVLGRCSYEPHGKESYFIDWDEEDTSGSQLDASVLNKESLHQISP